MSEYSEGNGHAKIIQLVVMVEPYWAIFWDEDEEEIFSEKINYIALLDNGTIHFIEFSELGDWRFPTDAHNFIYFHSSADGKPPTCFDDVPYIQQSDITSRFEISEEDPHEEHA